MQKGLREPIGGLFVVANGVDLGSEKGLSMRFGARFVPLAKRLLGGALRSSFEKKSEPPAVILASCEEQV